MRKAIFLTAYNRIPYLQQTLASWESVRGQEGWDFIASIEPGPMAQQVVEEFEEFASKTTFNTFDIRVNENVEGVLHHPWLCFEGLFGMGRYDFVVRAEDDLVVSNDILEFFSWSAHTYRDDAEVATVHAYTATDGPINSVRRSEAFSPWLWGTWRDRWAGLIGPTWDHDYSTFNGSPGFQSGWDWNLNTRIFPEYNLRSIVPVVSRANNIGLHGVHGTPENFERSDSFHFSFPMVQFTESQPEGR